MARKMRVTTRSITNVAGYYLEWRYKGDEIWRRHGGLHSGVRIELEIPGTKAVEFRVISKFENGIVSRPSEIFWVPEIKVDTKPLPPPVEDDLVVKMPSEKPSFEIQPVIPPDHEPEELTIEVGVGTDAPAAPTPVPENRIPVVEDQVMSHNPSVSVPMVPEGDETPVWMRYKRTDGVFSEWVRILVRNYINSKSDDSFDFSGAVDIPIDGLPTIVDDGSGGISPAPGPDPFTATFDPFAMDEMDPFVTDQYMQEMRFYGPKVDMPLGEERTRWLRAFPDISSLDRENSGIDPFTSLKTIFHDPRTALLLRERFVKENTDEVDPFDADDANDKSPIPMSVAIAHSRTPVPSFNPDDFKAHKIDIPYTMATYQPRFSIPRRGVGGKKITMARMMMYRLWDCCPCDCVEWYP